MGESNGYDENFYSWKWIEFYFSCTLIDCYKTISHYNFMVEDSVILYSKYIINKLAYFLIIFLCNTWMLYYIIINTQDLGFQWQFKNYSLGMDSSCSCSFGFCSCCSAWLSPKLNTKITLNHHNPPPQTSLRVLDSVGGQDLICRLL